MASAVTPILILAVDDHPLLRDGLAATIVAETDMKIVAEAGTGREAIDLYHLHRPDITLMDLRLPDMHRVDVIVAIR
jgi:DNA-binding NarL/FixJ family response regulator